MKLFLNFHRIEGGEKHLPRKMSQAKRKIREIQGHKKMSHLKNRGVEIKGVRKSKEGRFHQGGIIHLCQEVAKRCLFRKGCFPFKNVNIEFDQSKCCFHSNSNVAAMYCVLRRE